MNKRIICSLLCIMLVLPLASFSQVLAAENEGAVDIEVKDDIGLSMTITNIGDVAVNDDEYACYTHISLKKINHEGYFDCKSIPIREAIMPGDSYTIETGIANSIVGRHFRLFYFSFGVGLIMYEFLKGFNGKEFLSGFKELLYELDRFKYPPAHISLIDIQIQVKTSFQYGGELLGQKNLRAAYLGGLVIVLD
jgi:hypothetical protein